MAKQFLPIFGWGKVSAGAFSSFATVPLPSLSSRVGHTEHSRQCRRSSTPLPSTCCCYCLLLLSSIIIIFGTLFTGTNASIHGTIICARNRRQTPSRSAGTVNAEGNQTSMSATNALWKAPDGTVGANGTSTGTGTSNGTAGKPGQSSVTAGSNANVGNMSAVGDHIVGASGTQSQSVGSSSSMLNGAQQSGQTGTASGSAVGTGDAQVFSIGSGSLKNWTMPSKEVGIVGISGATGNQMAVTNTSNTYTMSWNSIFAKVFGFSMSKGENNSQANINLRGGTPTTNIAVDGLVSGVNDKAGGSSFSLAGGEGTLTNNTASMGSALAGAVNSTSGGSKLVGASNLETNGTLNKGAINTFGDLRLNGTGPGMGGFLSNSSYGPDGTARGAVAMSGIQNGANKSIGVSDGINANDGGPLPNASNGRGSLMGTGNLASNGTSFVLSGYQTGKGTSQIVDTQGQSMATNNTASELRINNQATEFLGKTATNNATSNAIGKVLGQSSSVTGGSMLNVSRLGGQNGNTSIVAQGGGLGPSSAMTDTALSLMNGPNNTMRNSNIRGNVNASGDQTYVQSVSNVLDQNRQQSLFNSQNATVKSAGNGQATASNSAVLRRRRRHSRNLAALSAVNANNWWQNVAPFAHSSGTTKAKIM